MTNLLFSMAVALVMMAIQTRFPGTPPWALAMYVPLVGAAALIYLEVRTPAVRSVSFETSRPMARPTEQRKETP